MTAEFKINPLGGLGQIGSNCCLFEDNGEAILVDSGILFPHENCFDLNYLIPDFNSLPSSLANIIITHGHEDHIGAIVHLLKKIPHINIYAPLFAAKLIEDKISYNKMSAKIIIYKNFDVLKFNSFSFTPFQVDHSIPHTFGLKIHHIKSQFDIIYMSDFKVNTKGETKTLNSIDKIKKELFPERSLLMLDSTNILSKQLKTTEEDDLIPQLTRIFSKPYSRFFVTTFASNIERLNIIIKSAIKAGIKHFSTVGRSVNKYINHAQELELLTNEISFIDNSEVKLKEKSLIFVSGCQGDFKSALRRIAIGNDNKFTPQEGDLFLFSSKAIPGNEKSLGNIYNELTVRGADIITTQDYTDIHTSGHAGKEDLSIVYKSLNCKYAIPIHGESYFLKRHFQFICDNFKTMTPISLHNGDSLQVIDGERFKTYPMEEFKHVFIHGKGMPIDSESLKERRKLATTGIVFVIYCLKNNKLLELKSLGIPREYIDHNKIKNVIPKIISLNSKNDVDSLNEEMRIAIRRIIFGKVGVKPVVEITSI